MQKLNIKNLGITIKTLRLKKAISQTELRNRLHITQNYMSLLETGKKSPSLKLLYAIGNFFNIEPGNILNNADKLGDL